MSAEFVESHQALLLAPPPAIEVPEKKVPEKKSGASPTGVSMLQDLLASLGKFDQEGRPAGHKLGFEIPEKALNDYLAYTLRTNPRPGIGAMTVTLWGATVSKKQAWYRHFLRVARDAQQELKRDASVGDTCVLF